MEPMLLCETDECLVLLGHKIKVAAETRVLPAPLQEMNVRPLSAVY